MAAAIKMDELLVTWLGNDTVFEDVQKLVESYRATTEPPSSPKRKPEVDETTSDSPRGVIPPFYPKEARERRRRGSGSGTESTSTETWLPSRSFSDDKPCARDHVQAIVNELAPDTKAFTVDTFIRVTKEVCSFPSFFNGPLFSRVLMLWNELHDTNEEAITMKMMEWFWLSEMEPYDAAERFFRLVKQPETDYVARDDFLPYIKELLSDHPVSDQNIEFLFLAHYVLTFAFHLSSTGSGVPLEPC